MLRLIYMWIENFRTLKEVNLNFHSNFEFEFEPIKKIKLPGGKESVVEGKLKIKKFNPDNDFINKYFPENQSISLIAGKNGTGKSSVLELLEYLEVKERYIFYKDRKYKYDKFFCIFLYKDKLLLWGTKDKENDTHCLKIEDITEGQAITLELPKNYIEGDIEDIYENIEKNFFGFDKNFCGEEGKDIAIRIYLREKEFRKKEFWEKPVLRVKFNKETESNYLKDNHSFLRNLFKCGNIEIISEILSHDNYTKFPDYFIIKFPFGYLMKDRERYSFEEFLEEVEKSKLSEDKKEFIRDLAIQLNNIMDKLIEQREDLDFIEKVKVILFIHLFLEFLYNIVKNDIGYWEYFIEKNQIKLKELENKYRKGIYDATKFKKFLKSIYNFYKKERIGLLSESVEKAENFIKALKKILRNKKKITLEEDYFFHFLQIEINLNKYRNDKKFVSKIRDLVESYLNLELHYFNPIKFDFHPPLSSGQKALLSVFADVSEVLDEEDCSQRDGEKKDNEKKDTQDNDNKENIILLLDEPDVYFHPEWQRLFIYFLTEFLKKKYQERESPNKKINKKIHTIITTHSPFMLSDVPKGNCVFLDLEYDEEEQRYITKAKSKDDVSDTLAQNIYYLLADGFFMEKGIGEYINNRLKYFLERINNGKLTKEKEEEFKKLIGNIGDSVLKNKLLNILERKEFYKEKLGRKEKSKRKNM